MHLSSTSLESSVHMFDLVWLIHARPCHRVVLAWTIHIFFISWALLFQARWVCYMTIPQRQLGPVPISVFRTGSLPDACVAQAQLWCLHVHMTVRLVHVSPASNRFNPSAADAHCVAVRGHVARLGQTEQSHPFPMSYDRSI